MYEDMERSHGRGILLSEVGCVDYVAGELFAHATLLSSHDHRITRFPASRYHFRTPIP